MQLNFPAVFNQAFGINTNFVDVTPLDDHGNPVTPQNGGSGSAQQNNGSGGANSTASAPNFGSCSTPEIQFADGLDNRKETAFAPTDSGLRPIPVL